MIVPKKWPWKLRDFQFGSMWQFGWIIFSGKCTSGCWKKLLACVSCKEYVTSRMRVPLAQQELVLCVHNLACSKLISIVTVLALLSMLADWFSVKVTKEYKKQGDYKILQIFILKTSWLKYICLIDTWTTLLVNVNDADSDSNSDNIDDDRGDGLQIRILVFDFTVFIISKEQNGCLVFL